MIAMLRTRILAVLLTFLLAYAFSPPEEARVAGTISDTAPVPAVFAG